MLCFVVSMLCYKKKKKTASGFPELLIIWVFDFLNLGIGDDNYGRWISSHVTKMLYVLSCQIWEGQVASTVVKMMLWMPTSHMGVPGFKVQLCSSRLPLCNAYSGGQQVEAQAVGPPPLRIETWIESLTSGCTRPTSRHCGCLRNEPAAESSACLCVSLNFSN